MERRLAGWIPALSSDTLSAQLFSLLDINSPKSRLSLMLPWSSELSVEQGPEGELGNGPGWGQRDELAQVPAVRSSATVCGKNHRVGRSDVSESRAHGEPVQGSAERPCPGKSESPSLQAITQPAGDPCRGGGCAR